MAIQSNGRGGGDEKKLKLTRIDEERFLDQKRHKQIENQHFSKLKENNNHTKILHNLSNEMADEPIRCININKLRSNYFKFIWKMVQCNSRRVCNICELFEIIWYETYQISDSERMIFSVLLYEENGKKWEFRLRASFSAS